MANRGKMPVSERAKIFIPFQPLTGFEDALRAVEVQVEQEAAAQRQHQVSYNGHSLNVSDVTHGQEEDEDEA